MYENRRKKISVWTLRTIDLLIFFYLLSFNCFNKAFVFTIFFINK